MANDILKQIWPEWEIEGNPLGKGSFGVVYKAVRSDFNVKSYSAVKVISIPTDPSEIDSLRSEGLDVTATRTYLQSIVNDFVNEIQLMESLKGTQNIVNVEDYQVVEKTDGIGWDIYIRMELLTPFNSYICDKKLAEPDVIKLGCDICSALEICGQRNIIHRDIKPENIFVNDFGFFKLGDFGIARKLENMTGGLSQKGTFNYMAPEVAKSNDYDSRVDIYSLGVVLYRLLNGNRLPFLDNDKQLLNPNERRAAIDRRLRGEPLPAPCDASPAMAEVILRACAYDPNARFASAVEMKQALTSVANGTYQMTKAFSAYGEPVSETPPKKTTVKYSDKTVALFGESNRQRVPARNSKDMAVGMAEKKYKFTKRMRAIMLALGIVCVILAFVVFVLPNIINRAGNLPAESGGNISDEQTSGLNVTSSSTSVSSSTSSSAATSTTANSSSSSKPVSSSSSKPVSSSSSKPVSSSSSQSVSSSSSKPVSSSSSKPVSSSSSKPVSSSSSKPVSSSSSKPVSSSSKPVSSSSKQSSSQSDPHEVPVTPVENSVVILCTEYSIATTTSLDLSHDWRGETNIQITDSVLQQIMPQIKKLTNLTELKLGNNDITDLTPISQLTNLTSLDFEWNVNIRDISPISKLINLQKLRMRGVYSDISFLANLKNLTYLDFGYNEKVSDISVLANLTKLTYLNLNDSRITDIRPLANLTNLTHLDLGGDIMRRTNQISDISPLSKLTNLTYLDLGANAEIKDISVLGNLTKLTYLNLQGNQISDVTPLSKLTGLTYLSLFGNNISDIMPLATLTNLTGILEVGRNLVDDDDVAALQAKLPNCTVRNLSGL